jgi:hypothetical protein
MQNTGRTVFKGLVDIRFVFRQALDHVELAILRSNIHRCRTYTRKTTMEKIVYFKTNVRGTWRNRGEGVCSHDPALCVACVWHTS